MTASRCMHCQRPIKRIDTHLAGCTSAPQSARFGAQLRSKSATARRKGVSW